MGLFTFLRAPDINAGVEEFRTTEGAVLLDVRTDEEYREGHIEGSTHLPLDRIAEIRKTVAEKSTPLYVYCRSGGRSGQAVSRLKQMGYDRVTNIGGIALYRGKVVR